MLIPDRNGDMHDPSDLADELDAIGDQSQADTGEAIHDAADVVRGLRDRLDEIAALTGSHRPLVDVLTWLADAATHLLKGHECEDHEREPIARARDEARRIAMRWHLVGPPYARAGIDPESRARDAATHWLNAVKHHARDDEDAAVDMIYTDIDTLLRFGNMASVDAILDAIDVNSFSVLLLLAFASITRPATPRLSARKRYIVRLRNWLNIVEPARRETLLAGLE